MDLQECREQLDVIDRQLVELFEKRMQICSRVAEYKIRTGKAVYDGQREAQKLDAVRDLAHGEQNQVAVRELFSQLMTISRRSQYKIMAEHGKDVCLDFEKVKALRTEGVRVVYQGVEGAYQHAATLQYFGEQVDAYHVQTFEDAMREVQDGHADYAVLPIENSSAGAVSDNYDLLTKYHNYIVAEIFLPVSHALLARPEAELSDIRTVFSHPQALMQSSGYLNAQREWRQISVLNTAVAAKKVADDGDVSQAAVASEIAGRLYGLKVLQPSIQNNKNNITRFIVLSRKAIFQEGASKVSVCFELPHRSGTLYGMLGHIIFNGINMVKIESRPIPDRNWEYRFFIDMEGNLEDAAIKNTLLGLRAEAQNLRILGNY